MILWIFAGLWGFCLWVMIAKKRYKQMWLLSAGFLFAFLCSVMLLVVYYVFPERTDWFSFWLCMMIGILLAAIGLYGLLAPWQCTQKTEGIYSGYQVYTSKGVSSYAPVFTYQYQGASYQEQSPYCETRRYLKQFTEGERYPIYINPENPRVFLMRRSIKIGYLFMLLIGIGIVAGGFFILSMQISDWA